MKQVKFVLASVCCIVAAASPAWGNDTAMITQGGSGSTVMIQQVATSGNNQATVRQGESWYGGGANHAQLMQYSVDNSRIDVVQGGANNQYSVHQFEGTNLHANVNVQSGYYGDMAGEGNSVDISQSGAGAYAWVEQANSMYSRAEIRQGGWGGQNMADIHQSGSGNQARIDQMGGAGHASIRQAGSNPQASIVQSSGSGYYGGRPL